MTASTILIGIGVKRNNHSVLMERLVVNTYISGIRMVGTPIISSTTQNET